MALLELASVTRQFGGLRAVSQVSLAVEEGEVVGLIGPNGAGKTTLFNLITGFLRPSAGAIRFGGASIVGLRPHAVAGRGVARTFQVVKPFPGLSVHENVTLAAFLRHRRRPDAERAALAAITELGLEARRSTLAGQLTLMDQKRLEMARALATEPRLLLLDEPLCGLNPTEIEVACGLVERIHGRGVTIMIVEHVMKAIMRISRRVVVMQHGEKIADGAPGAVVRDPAVVAAYFGKRAG